MDSNISELWSHLRPGGLFCLVLAGTEHQSGALMFGVKRCDVEKECNGSGEPGLGDDSDFDTAVCYR